MRAIVSSCRATAAHSARHGATGLAVLSLAACSSIHIPFISHATPDLTPARDSAENMVRLDAALRSGCESVQNIERPTVPPRSAAPQRWIAHTCTGDISYDVVTEAGPNGPVVKVLPVAGPLNRAANPNTRPVMPDDSGAPGK